MKTFFSRPSNIVLVSLFFSSIGFQIDSHTMPTAETPPPSYFIASYSMIPHPEEVSAFASILHPDRLLDFSISHEITLKIEILKNKYQLTEVNEIIADAFLMQYSAAEALTATAFFDLYDITILLINRGALQEDHAGKVLMNLEPSFFKGEKSPERIACLKKILSSPQATQKVKKRARQMLIEGLVTQKKFERYIASQQCLCM